jgi:hypothetical protein
MTRKEIKDRLLVFFNQRSENYQKSLLDADGFIATLNDKDYKIAIDDILVNDPEFDEGPNHR